MWQIRCESACNGVKVVSLNDFDPVKRRDDGCERDGDGFALSRIVFLRGWPHCWFLFSCAAFILDKRCECTKTLPRNDLPVEIVRIILL